MSDTTTTPAPATARPWPDLMTAGTLAEYLDISVRQVWRCAAIGELPPPGKWLGRTVWRKTVVDDAIAKALPAPA
jgi:hypothetical protein